MTQYVIRKIFETEESMYCKEVELSPEEFAELVKHNKKLEELL